MASARGRGLAVTRGGRGAWGRARAAVVAGGRRGAVRERGGVAMYRALYSFRSAEPNSLPFAAGETFLLLERSNQHWWLVTRAGSGETGYAPASYLQRLQVGRGRGAPGVGTGVGGTGMGTGTGTGNRTGSSTGNGTGTGSVTGSHRDWDRERHRHRRWDRERHRERDPPGPGTGLGPGPTGTGTGTATGSGSGHRDPPWGPPRAEVGPRGPALSPPGGALQG